MRPFERKLLKHLMRKSTRRRVALSGPAARENDDFEIRIENLYEGHDYSFLVHRVVGSVIEAGRWDGQRVCPICFKAEDIPTDTITITHYYRGFVLNYSSIWVAFLFDLLSLNRPRVWRQRRYDKSVAFNEDRFDLLRKLLQLRPAVGSCPLSLWDLLESLYGQQIHTSQRTDDAFDDLRFRLRSLEETGDIDLTDDAMPRVVVHPKALATVNQVEIDNQRHRDTMRVSRGQLWVAVAMLVLAAVTIIVQIWTIWGSRSK